MHAGRDAAHRNADRREAHHQNPDRTHNDPWHREQIPGGVLEHESDVAPPVFEALKVRLALTLVIRDRHLNDLHVARPGLHNHLAGDLADL